MKLNCTYIMLILALIACICGCESSGGTGGDPGSDYKYTLNGCFVQDVNISAQKVDFNHFAAKMTRNTTNLNSAQLFFGNTVLGFDTCFHVTDSVYTFTSSPRPYRSAEVTIINISDSTLFADTISTAVLDSIRITNSPDSSIPNQNGTPIVVEWSSAIGIHGYVVAVVLTNSAYSNAGYSVYVTDGATSTTIPNDAFRANLTNALDTGWYDIYVYGYTGSPDALLSAEILPVAFPSQLIDNIARTNLTGNFGSVVVSRKKMIRVVSQ